MAATDITITGLSHLIGQSVRVMIGGLDCGSFVVSTTNPGTVVVPLSSNPSLSGTFLQHLDVGPYDKTTYGDLTTQITMQVNGTGIATMYVPVIVGFSFVPLGQVLRPNAESVVKSPSGGATGKLRRVWRYAAQLTHSQGVQFGTDPSSTVPAQFQFANDQAYPANNLFDGVISDTIEDSDSFDGMLCWTVVGPYPCIMQSISSFVETKER